MPEEHKKLVRFQSVTLSTCSSVVEHTLDKRATKVRFLTGGLPINLVARVLLLQSRSHRFESDIRYLINGVYSLSGKT